jgi:hypothetical protein
MDERVGRLRGKSPTIRRSRTVKCGLTQRSTIDLQELLQVGVRGVSSAATGSGS